MAETLVLAAHAKLNLDLHVLGLRPDGYHEISTRLQMISLHDLLAIRLAPTTTLIGGCDDDLVLRAQRALEDATGRSLPVHFQLFKRIPVGAGLGGGSADAAATLRGLTRLYHLDADLHQVAESVGADVPFCLQGGAARASGRGEQLDRARRARAVYALAWPGFGISSRAVYAKWDEVGGDGANHLSRAALALEPRLGEFAACLGEGWRMTGSGTSFFKSCESLEQATASLEGLSCWTATVRPVNRGAS